MKCLLIISCLVAAALAVPVDPSEYQKQEYKEVEYNKEQVPVKQVEEHQVAPAPKYEEPLDKSIYPYVVSKGFPYDYRGFPYLNNEFAHGYPTPKQGFYSPLLPYAYNGAYNGAPAYNAPAYNAPAYNVPAYNVPAYNVPAYNAPARPVYNALPAYNAPVNYAPAAVHHAAPAVHEQPAYKSPEHPAPVKEEAKPEHDSMKYYGQFTKECQGDGIYFNNPESFVLCSNGNPYVQRCAPGTKNKGSDHYTYGSSYRFKDLCGINLVDTGYGPSNVIY